MSALIGPADLPIADFTSIKGERVYGIAACAVAVNMRPRSVIGARTVTFTCSKMAADAIWQRVIDK